MHRKLMLALLIMMPLAAPAQEAGQRAAKFNDALEKRFAAADTNGDGQLTRDEARAGMPRVYTNFDMIDSDRKGAVTLDQIRGVVVEKAAARRPRGVPGQGANE